MKTCNACRETKPLEAFHRNARARDGRQSKCKACVKAYNDQWRANNTGKNREYQREWQHREGRRQRARANYFLRTYGITLEQHAEMVEAQDGRCLICGAEVELHVDHDDRTGDIRGMLCGPHNRGIGMFDHDVALLLKAVDYLLGVRAENPVEAE